MRILNKLFFYLLITSNSLLVAQTNFEQGIKLENGTNLNFQGYSFRQEDAGDIIFSKYNNQEMARIRSEYNPVNDAASIVFSTTSAIKDTFIFSSLGNLGIGTGNPQNKLQIGDYRTNNSSKLSIPGVYNFEEVKLGQYGNGRAGLEMITHTGQTQSFGVRLYSGIDTGVNGLLIETADPSNSAEELNYTAKMVVSLNGNVGIGILNPKNKLDVKGTMHAQEVKVDMDWNWPDFVFKKNYKLPTLKEVEKHIAEKGHLENIPSEEEVLKNGINLGEMNAKLLQKIEELTLYMIEMKKENSEMKKENAEIKKENAAIMKENKEIKGRIEKMEKR